MNISLKHKYNFIIQHVVRLMDENIGSKKDYNLKNAKKER